MFFKETLITSLPFAVRDSRSPHICRAVPLSSSVFHTAWALSAPAGHLPLEGKATRRESPLLKKVAHHPCEPIRSPSTVIPSAAEGSLLHCRHMHTCALTQTTPWCFPLSPFSHSRFTGLQKGSLHFRASPFIKIDAKRRTSVCKEDFSTSLEMTIRQKRLVFRRGVLATSNSYFTTSYASFSSGAPKAREVLSFSASSFSRPSRPRVRSS